MFKLSRNQLLLVAAVIVIVVAGVYFMKVENFDSNAYELAKSVDLSMDKYDHQGGVDPQDPSQQVTDVEQNVQEQDNQMVVDVADVRPEDLLPNDSDADAWANANPKGTGSLELKNFLEAGHHVGVNTQSSNTRNANLSLRSEPANPRTAVSIWQNSTIGPDPYRQPLEIGGDF